MQAARHVPVVIDGFISGAAAMIACGLAPAAQPYLIAAHCAISHLSHTLIWEYNIPQKHNVAHHAACA